MTKKNLCASTNESIADIFEQIEGSEIVGLVADTDNTFTGMNSITLVLNNAYHLIFRSVSDTYHESHGLEMELVLINQENSTTLILGRYQ